MSDTPVKIALFGPGTVGSQVARLLTEQSADLASRVGAPLEVVGVYVRDIGKDRVGLDPALLTDDADALIAKADVVVELMGGIEPAKSIILKAIAAGAGVVTANKALLAAHGPELYEAADAANVDLYFEAAVAGAIPIIRPVRESLAGDHVRRILGIVNGTTNYVLDEMTARGLDYEVAVKQAQDLGYAEADPSADVDGFDAAAKAAILASLAFHQRVPLGDVYREGISAITAADVAAATDSGHVIKLLAIAERTGEGGDGGVSVRVHPALVPLSHPLASVHGAYNAVFVEAEAAGDLMFYGQGAGGTPTASAVLGDVVSVARHIARGGRGPRESHYGDLPVLPISASSSRFQLRMTVPDRPGVLAAIAAMLAQSGVSIETVRQQAGGVGTGLATLAIATHRAPESDVTAVLDALRSSDAVTEIRSVLRIEGE
ncbi:homoserine dehydrogenase [Demequina lutea]|uniref:Homoserine dehydrogenase n=1 Tax=Demequina lutea TaxID=431489 RepID=A0A7Y9ZB89_9MICO|nr:homoserine dehydrogenase [Demequina lutea]NYI42189.1 homoserine dehydrogenase [Demequina lutea]